MMQSVTSCYFNFVLLCIATGKMKEGLLTYSRLLLKGLVNRLEAMNVASSGLLAKGGGKGMPSVKSLATVTELM